jgi:hypothetical protein
MLLFIDRVSYARGREAISRAVIPADSPIKDFGDKR